MPKWEISIPHGPSGVVKAKSKHEAWEEFKKSQGIVKTMAKVTIRGPILSNAELSRLNSKKRAEAKAELAETEVAAGDLEAPPAPAPAPKAAEGEAPKEGEGAKLKAWARTSIGALLNRDEDSTKSWLSANEPGEKAIAWAEANAPEEGDADLPLLMALAYAVIADRCGLEVEAADTLDTLAEKVTAFTE